MSGISNYQFLKKEPFHVLPKLPPLPFCLLKGLSILLASCLALVKLTPLIG